MTVRASTLLCFVAALSISMAAQTEPVLTSANIPKYPPLACQARAEGVVKITFTLAANAAEATNVAVVSGPPLLEGAALENVKTWRFDNRYAVERKYETTFEYHLREIGAGSTKKLSVTLESFRKVEIVTDVYQTPGNY